MQRCQEVPHFRAQVSVHNTHHLISVCRVGRFWHLILKKHKLKKKKEKALPTFAHMIFEKQQKSSVTHDFLKTTQEHTHSLPSPYAIVAGFMSNYSEVWARAGRLSWSPNPAERCCVSPGHPAEPGWAVPAHRRGQRCAHGLAGVWPQAAVRLSRLRCRDPGHGPVLRPEVTLGRGLYWWR